MAKDIIRKGADGFELNFGPLVVGEINGIRFALEDWRAEMLKIDFVEAEEIPAFLDDLPLVVNYGCRAQINVYPFNKEDIKPLGIALSEMFSDPVCRVDVQHRARILMMWEKGVAIGEQRTLDHFYSELTEEEIEASHF